MERSEILRLEIEAWNHEGVIDAELAQRLLARYPPAAAGSPSGEQVSHLLAVGGVVLGLGLTALLTQHLALTGAALACAAMSLCAALATPGLWIIHGRGWGGVGQNTGRSLVVAASILAWSGVLSLITEGHLEPLQAFALLSFLLFMLSRGAGSILVMIQAQVSFVSAVMIWVDGHLEPSCPGQAMAALAMVGFLNLLAGRLSDHSPSTLARRVSACQHAAGVIEVQWALFALARVGWSGQHPWPERLGWSALLLLFSGLLLRAGLRLPRQGHKVLGILGLAMEIPCLYGEYLWSALPKAATFILIGIAIITMGATWEWQRPDPRGTQGGQAP